MEQKRLDFLFFMLERAPEQKKTKILNTIGQNGDLACLYNLLPLSKYETDEVKKTALGASIRIVHSSFKDEKEYSDIDIPAIRKLLDYYEQKYDSLEPADFSNKDVIKEKLLRFAGFDTTRTIPLKAAKQWMKLGQPVLNARNEIILNVGSELDPSILERLAKQTIYQITVKIPSYEQMPELEDICASNEKETKIIEEINAKFNGLENNTVMTVIKKAAIRYYVENEEQDTVQETSS